MATPLAQGDANSMNEDTGSMVGNVLANDTDADGDLLSVTSFEFGGVTYAAGTTASLTGVGALVVQGNGSYTFTPATHYSGSVQATYQMSDGANTASSTLNLTVVPIQDAPTLLLNSTTVVGANNSGNTLPPSTGLSLAFYNELALSTAAASNTANLEAAVESNVATSTTIVSGVGIAESEFDTGDAYRYTGYIYLEAGHSYIFSGYRDDTLQLKVGGNTLFSTGFNNWADYTSEALTVTTSGYYSFELNMFDGDGIGELTTYLAVDGGIAQALNSTNFPALRRL